MCWRAVKQKSNQPTIDRTRSNMGFFSNRGQVTPTWIVWCGWKSNTSEILWLSWLPARLTKIGSKVKSLPSGQHCLHYKSMGKVFITQEQVTPKNIIRYFIAVLVTCKFEDYPIKNEDAIDRTRWTKGFFGSPGQVTLKWIFWFHQNLNSSKNLWLSRLPASVMKR